MDISPEILEFLEKTLPGRRMPVEELVVGALTLRPDLSYRKLEKSLGVSRSVIQRIANNHGLVRKKRKNIESGKNTTETNPNSQ